MCFGDRVGLRETIIQLKTRGFFPREASNLFWDWYTNACQRGSYQFKRSEVGHWQGSRNANLISGSATCLFCQTAC